MTTLTKFPKTTFCISAADHEVILDKNLIIIPVMAEGKVIALKVK